MDLGDIKFKEIQLVIDLSQSGGVRELSRSKGWSPGQISKWIASIEQKLERSLFERTTQGLVLTPDGEELLPVLKRLQETWNDLSHGVGAGERPRELTFATTSFFSTHILPHLFEKIRPTKAPTRFRLIDLAPNQLMAVAMRGGFELAVHIGSLDWPKTWVSQRVGDVTWKLYCRKDHPMGSSHQLSKVLRYPFVYPFYWTPEGMKYGNDHCPLPINKRKMGDLTATATSAVEVVLKSDQFGFLPDVAARPAFERGDLIEKKIRGWKPVSKPVFLSVKADRVTKPLFDQCIETLRGALS